MRLTPRRYFGRIAANVHLEGIITCYKFTIIIATITMLTFIVNLHQTLCRWTLLFDKLSNNKNMNDFRQMEKIFCAFGEKPPWTKPIYLACTSYVFVYRNTRAHEQLSSNISTIHSSEEKEHNQRSSCIHCFLHSKLCTLHVMKATG